jgi:NTP pyrophosphatase (non-canonical NTP hydrolase)
MADEMDLRQLQEWVTAFAAERGWERVRTLKDLGLAIGIEAAELQEHFLWVDPSEERRLLGERQHEIEEELADILIYCLAFADRAGIDLLAAAEAKMHSNERRFPPGARSSR